MATIWADGDIIRITARLRDASGDDIENVYHYKIDSPGGVFDNVAMPLLADRIDDMYDYIEPEIPADVTFVDMDFANLTQELVYAAVPWPVQTVGGGTGDTMPEQCTALVVARTDKPKVLGRKFLGPFIEAANLDGVWRTTLTGFLTDFMNLYIDNLSLGLGSSAIPGVPRIVNGIVTLFTFFTEVYSTNGVYTQRRRRRGVGS